MGFLGLGPVWLVPNSSRYSSITNQLRAVIFIPDLLSSEWSQKGSGGNAKRHQTTPNCAATRSKKCFDVVKTPFGYRLTILALAGGSNLVASSSHDA